MRRAALCLVLAACRTAADSAAPEAHGAGPPEVAIRRGTLTERVVLTGELQPSFTGSVNLQVPALDREVSIRFLAEDGMAVKKGDRVIEFDNSAFTEGLEQKHVAATDAETTARTADQLAAISQADKEAELRQREIDLEKATLRAGVPADLLSAHDAQQAQLDKARAEVAVTKAKRDVDSLRESDQLERHVRELARDKAKRAVDDAESAIHQLAVTAPADGVVVVADHPWQGRKFIVGDTIWPGFTIARIPDSEHALEVHADLSDVDDGRVAVGMAGTCTLDAYPAAPVPCTVTDLTPVARDKGKTSLRRTFAVTLALGVRDPHQRPGMSVKVVLTRPPVPDVLLAPRGAIVVAEDGKRTQARLASGELRDITLGACDAQACAVGSGLAEGERVRP